MNRPTTAPSHRRNGSDTAGRALVDARRLLLRSGYETAPERRSRRRSKRGAMGLFLLACAMLVGTGVAAFAEAGGGAGVLSVGTP
ncbi:MAG: hypothetical protein ABW220_01990 [Burkholderiaceae bacterium]